MHHPTKTVFLATLLACGSIAQAGIVSVYDYMNGLGGTYPAQTGSEPWTFHYGDENGTLMPQYAGVGYGYGPTTYAQFTSPGGPGSAPGSAGSAEKNGIFTHTAWSGYVTAVLQVTSPVVLSSIALDYEMVGNGNQGSGVSFTLRTVKSGIATDHGSVNAAGVYTNTTKVFDLAGLSLGSGDKIAVLVSNNGDYWYDHAWWNIGFTEKTSGGNPPPSHGVPDTASTLALSTLALAGLAALRRRN